MSESVCSDVDREQQKVVDPNFLVIGAQKGGTSWLANMVKQHPDVFAPEVKEQHFFNLRENYDRGIEWYRSKFEGRRNQKAVGEFTPNYLWICPNQQEIDDIGVIPNIPEIVHQHYPDLKLIVSLRNPVDRAVSAYYHFIRTRKIPPTSKILEIGHTNGIITMGDYKEHLLRWLEYYPIERFHFIIYEEDIARNKSECLRRVFRFLEIDETFEPANQKSKVNARLGHLYMWIYYYAPLFARGLFKLLPFLRPVNFPKITVSESEIAQLKARYQETNKGLAELIGRPLPW
ncbi:sulfotransferase domain-containing protein [Pelagicoccus sp. NFK12]|uniref:Sulfotransferase domain-containing protein n=1 Tax=Pelagicoccus enzymogenes TaxID=2773457 RepID=A0A927IGH3_9BACT|nr:sulfotransferase domain-containing protein [Pelagicoccus enzymogenes]MBD5781197.1 sulfotransferase domain-containing protein [Pelagicoccus enzymogenes]MDQ8198901.1 sulfotransferase domain-containing protein [Pelagicoccus enzymogenes]